MPAFCVLAVIFTFTVACLNFHSESYDLQSTDCEPSSKFQSFEICPTYMGYPRQLARHRLQKGEPMQRSKKCIGTPDPCAERNPTLWIYPFL